MENYLIRILETAIYSHETVREGLEGFRIIQFVSEITTPQYIVKVINTLMVHLQPGRSVRLHVASGYRNLTIISVCIKKPLINISRIYERKHYSYAPQLKVT